MRITTSDNYYHGWECALDDCQRQYCSEHRLLWRECETMRKGMDDTYSNGRPHYVFELGDCPVCEAHEQTKRFKREMQTLGGLR